MKGYNLMARGLNDDLNRFYGDQNRSSSPPFDGAIWKDGKWVRPASIITTGAKAQYDAGYGQCYAKHPPLTIPGTDLKIWGGSCHYPIVKDADIYIGFDHGMELGGPRSWPWKEGEEFLFAIQDMGVPKHPDEFVKLVDWTASQLRAGKKVHCGCIGGHGRTGMFLAALVCTMAGMADSISYVRENYCRKVVETEEQMNFLFNTFGIVPIQGSKPNTKFVNKQKLTPDLFAPAKPRLSSSFKDEKVDKIEVISGYSIWD